MDLHKQGLFVCLCLFSDKILTNLLWDLIEQNSSLTNLHSLPMDLHKEGLFLCQFFPSCILRHLLICSFIERRVKALRTVYTPYYQWAFTNIMECLFAIVTFLRLDSEKPGR